MFGLQKLEEEEKKGREGRRGRKKEVGQHHMLGQPGDWRHALEEARGFRRTAGPWQGLRALQCRAPAKLQRRAGRASCTFPLQWAGGQGRTQACLPSPVGPATVCSDICSDEGGHIWL